MAVKRLSFRTVSSSDVLELQLWKRVFAFILDYLLLSIIILPAIISVAEATIPAQEESNYYPSPLHHVFGPYAINFIIFCLYFALLESSNLQGTLGKQFVGFKVCDSKGDRISFFRALFRFLFKFISVLTILGIGMIDLNKQRRGLHDIICNTFIRKR